MRNAAQLLHHRRGEGDLVAAQRAAFRLEQSTEMLLDGISHGKRRRAELAWQWRIARARPVGGQQMLGGGLDLGVHADAPVIRPDKEIHK
jgi:hypothetical protein